MIIKLKEKIIKTVQVSLNIGKGDLERKVKQAQKFLSNKEQVRIALVVKGRQKARTDTAVEFLNEIHETYMQDCGNLVKAPNAGGLFLTYMPLGK